MPVPDTLRRPARFVFKRSTFCCCLPVRYCVLGTSFLGFFLASLLSIILWFEVASTPTLTSGERKTFIGAGVLESLLAIICAIGFIGTLAHKLTLITTYCVGLYVHFAAHLIAVIVFLVALLRASHADGVVACQHAIKDSNVQDTCLDLLHVVVGVFAGIAGTLLAVELYAAIVATRFVYTTRDRKREDRLMPGGKKELVPSFVRYVDAKGNTVYDRYYYPQPDATKVYAPVKMDEEEGADVFDPYQEPVKHVEEDARGYLSSHMEDVRRGNVSRASMTTNDSLTAVGSPAHR